jgi:hypothetical protein
VYLPWIFLDRTYTDFLRTRKRFADATAARLDIPQRNGTFTRQLIARERLEGAKHTAQIDQEEASMNMRLVPGALLIGVLIAVGT